MERVVAADWENGYVECSAMFNSNISAVFRALLHQARCNIYAVSTLSTYYLHIIYYYLQVGSGPAAAGRVPGP